MTPAGAGTGRATARRRLGWLVGAGPVLYAAFVWGVFAMESYSRDRFHVLSDADVAALTDHKAQVRARASKQMAEESMWGWGPYVAYSGAVLLIVLGGTVVGSAIASRTVWRGVKKDSVAKAKPIFVGVSLAALFLLLALSWPWIVAQRRMEQRRTTFSTDTLRKVAPN